MQHRAHFARLLAAVSLILSLAALSCGRGKPSAEPSSQQQNTRTRNFPAPATPQMMGDPFEQACYLVQHYWDGYFKSSGQYRTDSLYVGGVENEAMEEAYGIFTSQLWAVPLEEAQTAIRNLFKQMSRPEVPQEVSKQIIALSRLYLYDPNSPLRCEDFFLPLAEGLLASDLIPEEERMQYEHEVQMCRLNAIGTQAADFVFIDTKGLKRTLYGIDSEYTLLVFGNPDCHACKELVEMMAEDDIADELVKSGRLTVVDIYIDQDIDLWKERMHSYPKAWINGYDPSFEIRNDHLYNIRAVPSMYLLDKDKKVLLKDASEPILMRTLQWL